MTVYREYQTVELVRDVASVPAGTPGVVVGIYGNGGFEVEFLDDAGRTTAVATVGETDLRAVD